MKISKSRKWLISIGGLCLSILIFLLIINGLPNPEYSRTNIWLRSHKNRPLIIAHGGAKSKPGNTRIACNFSRRVGADALELDLRLTKDLQLVLHHDASINRMAGLQDTVAILVKGNSYAELLKFNFCHGFTDVDECHPYRDGTLEYDVKECQIPLLDDVLAEYPEFLFNLEIKDEEELGLKAADELNRLLIKHGKVNQTLIASFHNEVNEYLDERYPDLTHSASLGPSASFVFHSLTRTSYFYKPKAAAFQVPLKFKIPLWGTVSLDKELLIRKAHSHNMGMHYWTVNDTAEMRRLIEAGADAILTDYPDIAWKILRESGL